MQQDIIKRVYKKDLFCDCKFPIISLEAGSTLGWQKYSHFQIGVDKFGEAGTTQEIREKYGFTVEKIKKKGIKKDELINTKRLMTM